MGVLVWSGPMGGQGPLGISKFVTAFNLRIIMQQLDLSLTGKDP